MEKRFIHMRSVLIWLITLLLFVDTTALASTGAYSSFSLNDKKNKQTVLNYLSTTSKDTNSDSPLETTNDSEQNSVNEIEDSFETSLFPISFHYQLPLAFNYRKISDNYIHIEPRQYYQDIVPPPPKN
nr:hypothetical protein [uncultured Flavobacterium sp.]